MQLQEWLKTKKRRNNDTELNSTEPPSKKRKINTVDLPLFTEQCLKINARRTIAELENIPDIMIGPKKYYLTNKFYIAADAEISSKPHRNQFERPFGGERAYSFIDEQNNICLITDSYQAEQFTTSKRCSFKSCTKELYHNPPSGSEPNVRVNDVNIECGNYHLWLHRTYVLILRTPFQNFVDKYRNSFEEFVIKAAKIFETKASAFVAANPQPRSILHILADFFEDDAEFDPKSVLSQYHDTANNYNCYNSLLREYRKKVASYPSYLSVIFINLYELYDKPWIKLKEREQCIKMCWDKLEQKLDYFESAIAETIIGFVHEKPQEYDFEKFIEDEKLKWSGISDGAEFKPHHSCGRYTHFYEKEMFAEGFFLLNPFKWKYLSEGELEDLKKELTLYVESGSISWDEMSKYDDYLDTMYRLYEQGVEFVGESKFDISWYIDSKTMFCNEIL